MGRIVNNKWLKTKAIVKHDHIRQHVPVTERCSYDMLKSMLEIYKMVYIKPVYGMQGKGVVRIEQSESSNRRRKFKFQHGKYVGRFEQFSDMYRALTKIMGDKRYLVQKGIHMLKLGSSDFDIRVMIQLSPERKWEATAEISRVAHPGKVVTNVHSGGALKPPGQLLDPYMNEKQKTAFITHLRTLGLKVAEAMHKRFRGIRDLGLDIAIDKDLKPWILEVNTTPDPYIFRKLKNKRIFAKVLRYAKYNRRKSR